MPTKPDAGDPSPGGPRRGGDLRDLKLPEVRIETKDELLEKLVAEGKAERSGFEESRKVAWQRGGARRLVLARTKYRAIDAQGESVIETTPMPPECFPRSLAAPSLLAHVFVEKLCDGRRVAPAPDREAAGPRRLPARPRHQAERLYCWTSFFKTSTAGRRRSGHAQSRVVYAVSTSIRGHPDAEALPSG